MKISNCAGALALGTPLASAAAVCNPSTLAVTSTRTHTVYGTETVFKPTTTTMTDTVTCQNPAPTVTETEHKPTTTTLTVTVTSKR